MTATDRGRAAGSRARRAGPGRDWYANISAPPRSSGHPMRPTVPGRCTGWISEDEAVAALASLFF